MAVVIGYLHYIQRIFLPPLANNIFRARSCCLSPQDMTLESSSYLQVERGFSAACRPSFHGSLHKAGLMHDIVSSGQSLLRPTGPLATSTAT